MLKVILLGLLLTGPCFAEPWTPSLVYGGAAGADLISTHQALRVANTQEANPLLRGPLKQQLAIKLGTTAVMVYFDTELQKHGHHKAAWIMRGVWILLHGVVVGYNFSH
jgi:hypothetical protein